MAAYKYNNFLKLTLILINFNITPSAAAGNAVLANLVDTNNLGYQFFQQISNQTDIIVAPGCLAEVEQLLQGLIENELWALRFVDAWGKFPAGILSGNLMEMGNFEQCLSINVLLMGKYCLAAVPLGPIINQQDALNLQIGTCLPAACSAAEMDLLLKRFLNNTLILDMDESTLWLQESSCSVQERQAFDPLDFVAIGFLLLLAIIIALSTTVECYYMIYKKTPAHALLKSFSLHANIKQLFHISTKSNSPNVIPCLHGIRCMSLIWIIFGHGCMMLLISPNVNAVDILAWVQSPFSMFLQTGTISVDTFFFLSGLLLVLIVLRKMDRNAGKLNVPQMYLHRYLRLTPILAVAVLFFMTLYRFMGNGPLWRSFVGSYTLCEETWWATLLYVQNYAAAGKMCLGHSWYLAIDMQLFILSPLILIPIWKWQRKGLAALFVIGILLVACLFSIIVVDELSVMNIFRNVGTDNVEMQKIYYSTQTRTSPWIIGIMFGYFIHQGKGRRIELSKIYIILGWIVSLSLLFTVLFSLYGKFQLDSIPITSLESAFYLSLSRVAWPLALCWIVFACINGYAGPVNHFLSWPLWQPISKLSYSMYIWHLLVVMANTGRIKTNTHFSDYDVILLFWSHLGVTFMVAIIMYLAVEGPIVNIERLLLNQPKIVENAPVRPEPTTAVTTISTISVSQQNLIN